MTARTRHYNINENDFMVTGLQAQEPASAPAPAAAAPAAAAPAGGAGAAPAAARPRRLPGWRGAGRRRTRAASSLRGAAGDRQPRRDGLPKEIESAMIAAFMNPDRAVSTWRRGSRRGGADDAEMGDAADGPHHVGQPENARSGRDRCHPRPGGAAGLLAGAADGSASSH